MPFAAFVGTPVLVSPRAEDILPVLEGLAPVDVAVSMNFPGIVPQAVIDPFHRGGSRAGDARGG